MPLTSHFRYDFHMHSTFSDGSNVVFDMAEACINKGISHMAFTDHLTVDGFFLGYRGINRNPKLIEEYLKRITELRHLLHHKINIFTGAEISEDYMLEDHIQKSGFTTHLRHFSLILIEGWFISNPVATAINIRKMLDRLEETDLPVVLAHPEYNSMEPDTFRQLISHNIGMELNNSKFYKGQATSFLRLLGTCSFDEKQALQLSFGSDAHDYTGAGEVDYVRDFLIQQKLTDNVIMPRLAVDF